MKRKEFEFSNNFLVTQQTPEFCQLHPTLPPGKEHLAPQSTWSRLLKAVCKLTYSSTFDQRPRMKVLVLTLAAVGTAMAGI